MLPAVAMFRNVVVRPALESLGLQSYAAEMLVLGTAAQESQFKYLEQLSGGPGIGLYQMEEATHEDIWDNFLKYRRDLAPKAAHWATAARPDAGEMAWNLRYATAMTRLHYFRVDEHLPVVTSFDLASYWKRYYNTWRGAGRIAQFIEQYERFVA